MKRIFLIGLLLAVGAVAGCDSSNGSDEQDDDITGQWQATLPSTSYTTFGLPAWTGLDSLRYDYAGRQNVTLDIESLNGTDVQGRITWAEDATYTVTRIKGAARNAEASVEVTTKQGAFTGTYADGKLRLLDSDNPNVEVLIENAEVTFIQNVGRATIQKRYMSVTFNGGENGTYTVDMVVPFDLRFRRVVQ